MKILYKVHVIALTLTILFTICNMVLTTKTYASSEINENKITKIAARNSGSKDAEQSEDDLITIDDQNAKKIYQPNTQINNVASKVLGVISTICYAAAVIIVLIKGVQMVMSAPDQKAQVSEQLIGVTIGGVILFTIGTIIKIVAQLSQQVVS